MRTLFDLTPWRCEAPQDFIYGGACHPVDLLRWIAGGILEVSCYSQASGMDSRYPEGVMENLLMNLRFENGVVGRVLAVFGLVEPPQTMNGLAVYGTEGIFVEDSAIFNRLEGLPEWNMEFRPEAGHGNEVLRYMRRFEECVAACSAARESARSLQPVKVFNDF